MGAVTTTAAHLERRPGALRVLSAIVLRPFTVAAWRDTAYLLLGAVTAAVAFAVILAGTIVGGLLAITILGLPVILLVVLVMRVLARLDRRRAALVLEGRIEARYRSRDAEGLYRKALLVLKDPATWRDEGLARLLAQGGLEVVETVEDGGALVRAVERTEPDVAVVDVRLPPTFSHEGLEAALEVRRRRPGTPILVLSQYVEQAYAVELLADGAGGVGYLLKDRVADVRDFLDAVRRVAGGGTAMDPEVVSQLVARRGGPLDDLTPREREVLELMAEGRSNAGIAEVLVVTEGAVEKHVSSIFQKLRLPPDESQHRRVLAVLAFLRS